MSKFDLRKHYLKLAYEQLNPTENSLTALQQVLINWFCFQFNTTPNDKRLMSMHLDELLTLRMMYEIREHPEVMEELQASSESYEDWLKKEMGSNYRSADQAVEELEKMEEEELKIAKSLPDRIDTDFSSVIGE